MIQQRPHLDVSPELLAGVKAVQALVGARGCVEAPVIIHDVDDLQIKALHSTPLSSGEPLESHSRQ